MSNILLAHGFEDAFLGVGRRMDGYEVAIYDYEKAVGVLMVRDGMDAEEADEFMQFNVTGAWVGDGTPLWITRQTLDQFLLGCDTDGYDG